MRVAIYCRTSTTEQETANQLIVLQDWAKARGFEVVAIYQEQESAWRAGHQAELAKLIEDAHKLKFDAVLTFALDRLSREGSLAILQLIDKFKQYGIKVISYQESWTEAPGELAEVLYAIAGWVARMESQRRSERVKAGLERARRENKGKRGKDTIRRKRRWWKRPKT
jgi:DNA invertase Pin-like site-specific DNA recombinase